jgi:hypothetical protein
LEAAQGKEVGLAGKLGGNCLAEPIDPGFEGMVEHVAQHQHAATHPLPGTGEFGMVELSHRTPAAEHRKHHLDHGLLAEAVALGQFIDDLKALGGELFHGRSRVRPTP